MFQRKKKEKERKKDTYKFFIFLEMKNLWHRLTLLTIVLGRKEQLYPISYVNDN